jgi:hypothetical protein
MIHSDANTKLIIACDSSDFNMMREAIREGADVNCKTRKGLTPLLIAAGKNPELVPVKSFLTFLINHGANGCFVSSKGKSVISSHFFAEYIDPEVFGYLITEVTGPNLTSIISVKNQQYQVTLLDLMEIHSFSNKLINRCRQWGVTHYLSTEEIDTVRNGLKKKYFQFLKPDNGAISIEKAEETFRSAMLDNNTATAYQMIACGVDYLTKDDDGNYATTEDGRTLLHIAAEHKDEALIVKLIDNGFEVNQKDQKGRTPLYYCGKAKKYKNYDRL